MNMNEAESTKGAPFHEFPHAADQDRPERIEFHQLPVGGVDDEAPIDPDASHATVRVNKDLDAADRTSGRNGLSVARAALANTRPSVRI